MTRIHFNGKDEYDYFVLHLCRSLGYVVQSEQSTPEYGVTRLRCAARGSYAYVAWGDVPEDIETMPPPGGGEGT